MISVNTHERFWSKVDKTVSCWNWSACTDKDGYGIFWLNDGNSRAHRVSMMLEGCDIPSGMMVCHTCDNPSCVNPDHLYIGDSQTNVDDMIERGRVASQRGEMNGHSKLTESIVREIRDRVFAGETQRAVAKSLNIDHKHVNMVILRKCWKHIP